VPEYPDITVYIEAMSARMTGRKLQKIRFAGPFFLRTIFPPAASFESLTLLGFERIGKRIVFVFPEEKFAILHLMVSGRLHWKAAGAGMPGKIGLAAFDFENGTLTITEASTKKRASLHLVQGRHELAAFERGGLNVLETTCEIFAEKLRSENHTLKRALTDPRLFDGIGNAYSDEILHDAGLSPAKLTQKMTAEETERLYSSCRSQLLLWTDRLRSESATSFPEKVTAFREDMAVHGKFGKPCPRCATVIQRIRYADNETNYCPRCQTDNKLLSDRSLARLLRDDWPRTIDELENRQKKY
jgi:formamidopyrimidine-DNA glycosylase